MIDFYFVNLLFQKKDWEMIKKVLIFLLNLGIEIVSLKPVH